VEAEKALPHPAERPENPWEGGKAPCWSSSRTCQAGAILEDSGVRSPGLVAWPRSSPSGHPHGARGLALARGPLRVRGTEGFPGPASPSKRLVFKRFRITEAGRASTKPAGEPLFNTGSVVEQIWEQIVKSQVLLADLTGKNANVFYELGLAHAARKPVVFAAGQIEDIPFDLRHLRVIVYDVREPKWRLSASL